MSTTEMPILLETPPNPAPPAIPPGCREINGRVIKRETRGGIVRWMELQPQLPTRVNGVLVPRPPVYVPIANDDPYETLKSLDFAGEPFDPREPNLDHDEMEKAIACGFPAWGAWLAAQRKLRPRPEYGEKLLGSCRIAYGCRRKLPLHPDQARGLLRRCLDGDWGIHGKASDIVWTEDSKFAPPLFGVGHVNKATIEAGEGLVTSLYKVDCFLAPSPQEVRIVTHLNTSTLIYSTRYDV